MNEKVFAMMLIVEEQQKTAEAAIATLERKTKEQGDQIRRFEQLLESIPPALNNWGEKLPEAVREATKDTLKKEILSDAKRIEMRLEAPIQEVRWLVYLLGGWSIFLFMIVIWVMWKW